ncbi:hypothetical protein AAC387_Pa06g2345 [Persea americana]
MGDMKERCDDGASCSLSLEGFSMAENSALAAVLATEKLELGRQIELWVYAWKWSLTRKFVMSWLNGSSDGTESIEQKRNCFSTTSPLQNWR